MNVVDKIPNIIGVIFAVWFLLTSWIWTYWGALYISYPVGLLSLLILLFSSNQYAKQTIKIILIAGFIVSATALILIR